MELLLIFIAGFSSAFLFDLLALDKSITKIAALSKESLKVMNSGVMTDEEKQKNLFSISGHLCLTTLKITVFTFIATLPFVLLYFRESIAEQIFSVKGILASCAGLIVYYSIKKLRGNFKV